MKQIEALMHYKPNHSSVPECNCWQHVVVRVIDEHLAEKSTWEARVAELTDQLALVQRSLARVGSEAQRAITQRDQRIAELTAENERLRIKKDNAQLDRDDAIGTACESERAILWLKRQLATADATAQRLREALPDVDKLRLLARWFDVEQSANRLEWESNGVQADLREWADAIEAALADTPQPQPALRVPTLRMTGSPVEIDGDTPQAVEYDAATNTWVEKQP